MPRYTFEDLSPIDFEELARDLLQKHLGVTFESFKEGKDQGIDLRHSKNSKNDIIVQCKRYGKLTDLKSNLKKEVKKVLGLKPKRYIIVTSVALTPKNKKEIKNTFKNIRLLQKDIYGKNDINNLLGKYPDIEKQHFKLWLNSSSVLDKILHKSIYNRSEFERQDIEREIRIFVSSESNKEAIQILNKNNFVIISGIPGIGKTTLAKMLLYNYIIEGWDIISVSSDIQEGENLFNPDLNQVFYYDDFLGTNFLVELISKNEDKRIVKFIERIKRSKNKKLIMTTREYILNQAIERFESLKDKTLEIGKCTIDLKKYTKLIKGKILYNHLFYSELEKPYILELLKENRFLKIINHRNYNPRLIQYLTDKKFISDSPVENYFQFFIENLVNPQQIWGFAFASHISTISRYLLIQLLFLGEPVLREDLFFALVAFYNSNSKYYGDAINELEFEKCLKECERTFIAIEISDDTKTIIRFQNPSIKDFLLKYLSTYPELIKHLIISAIYFNQFYNIFSTDKYSDKVYLNDFAQRIIFGKIKKIFYNCPTSILIHTFDSHNFEFIWKVDHLTPLERLLKIAELFQNGTHKDVPQFLINEFYKIDLQEEVFGEYELNLYLSFLIIASAWEEFPFDEIFQQIFAEDKIENFESLKAVSRSKLYFPIEYQQFKDNHDQDIASLIENVIDKEYRDVELFFSKSKAEEFIEEVSNLEQIFDFNYQTIKQNAYSLIDENKENESDAKKLSKTLEPKIENSVIEDTDLIYIFDSLKYLDR